MERCFGEKMRKISDCSCFFSFLLDAWDQGNTVSQTFATRCSESRPEGPMTSSVMIECAERCVCKESVSLRTPKTKFSEQWENEICLSHRDKRQGIRQMGDRGWEERGRAREKGQGCLSWRDKGLPLGREETDTAHSKWWFIKVRGESPH